MTFEPTALTDKDREAVNDFVGRSFWIVGSFCFVWETLVIAALYRVTDTELPLLGKCSGGEALVLTLTFFWPLLIALHWLVHVHQGLTPRGKFSARFPGVLGDKEIPRPLARFRVLLFVILLFWPTLAHVVLTVRSFTHMLIVYNHDGEAYSLPDNHEPGGIRPLQYRDFAQLACPSRPRDSQGNILPGEWRWVHWRDLKPMNVAPPSAPARMAITPEHWPTAFPLIQPWLFLLAAVGLTVSTFWLIVRAWRRK